MTFTQLRYSVILLTLTVLLEQTAIAAEIRQQQLNMETPDRSEIRTDRLLVDEIPEVEATHVAMAGPAIYSDAADEDHALIMLFLSGKGRLFFRDEHHEIDTETIALPINFDKVTIGVHGGEVLHFLVVRKAYNNQDRDDMPEYANRASGGLYFKKFSDCEPYTEAIKSPKTVSRTVLPNQYIPRVAMGTVETSGPDEVGAHRHPMLDQLFLALAENDTIVTADESHAPYTEFSLLHIPLGSLHGVKVDPGKKLYYMWMDFFQTKEGEEWLKTHKPATK